MFDVEMCADLRMTQLNIRPTRILRRLYSNEHA